MDTDITKYSLRQLKLLASALSVKVDGDLRLRETWITAINENHAKAKTQAPKKLAKPAAVPIEKPAALSTAAAKRILQKIGEYVVDDVLVYPQGVLVKAHLKNRQTKVCRFVSFRQFKADFLQVRQDAAKNVQIWVTHETATAKTAITHTPKPHTTQQEYYTTKIDVAQHKHSCTCPDWVGSTKPHQCKHIMALMRFDDNNWLAGFDTAKKDYCELM